MYYQLTRKVNINTPLTNIYMLVRVQLINTPCTDFRELPTTSGVNPVPQPRSTTYSSSSREEKNGYEVAPGLDQVLEEKRYKGTLSSGYPSDDILESRYGGRISPPSRRHYESPSEYQHIDSGYPSTSPVCKQLIFLISFCQHHSACGIHVLTWRLQDREETNVSNKAINIMWLKLSTVEGRPVICYLHSVSEVWTYNNQEMNNKCDVNEMKSC